MTSLLLTGSFRGTDLRVMRVSAYYFPSKIELKCFTAGCFKMHPYDFFFQRNSRMSEA